METQAKIQFWKPRVLDPKLTLQYLMIVRFGFIILSCCVLHYATLQCEHTPVFTLSTIHFYPCLKHCNSVVVLIVDRPWTFINCLLLVPLFRFEHQVQHLLVHKTFGFVYRRVIILLKQPHLDHIMLCQVNIFICLGIDNITKILHHHMVLHAISKTSLTATGSQRTSTT
jgi:hypothetical protein